MDYFSVNLANTSEVFSQRSIHVNKKFGNYNRQSNTIKNSRRKFNFCFQCTNVNHICAKLCVETFISKIKKKKKTNHFFSLYKFANFYLVRFYFIYLPSFVIYYTFARACVHDLQVRMISLRLRMAEPGN